MHIPLEINNKRACTHAHCHIHRHTHPLCTPQKQGSIQADSVGRVKTLAHPPWQAYAAPAGVVESLPASLRSLANTGRIYAENMCKNLREGGKK